MYSNSSYQNKTEKKNIYFVISEVIGYYIIPAVNIISLLSNLIFCIIILKLKNSSRFYNILLAKQIQDILSAIVGIGWQNFHCTFCEDQVYNTYFFFYYRIYFLRFPMSVLYFNSILLDILIMIERYNKIYSKENFFDKVPIKIIFPVMTIIVIILFLPDYFAIEIKPTDIENIVSYGFTNIGKTQW